MLPVVRTLSGTRAESVAPEDASQGRVWRAIVDQCELLGSESIYITVTDTPREVLSQHPWSIGGGTSEVKELIETASSRKLQSCVAVSRYVANVNGRLVTRETKEIGVFGMTNADDVMIANSSAFARAGVESHFVRPLVVGDVIRDWSVRPVASVVFPYRESGLVPIGEAPGLMRWLWCSRAVLESRATFSGGTYRSDGRPWWEWHQVALRRLAIRPLVTFSFVATHNHFAFAHVGDVYKQTAPIIALSSPDQSHARGLLGVLNSSVACLWLKQVCHNRGGGGIGGGLATEEWEQFFEFTASALSDFPLPRALPVDIASRILALAHERDELAPRALIARSLCSREQLAGAKASAASVIVKLIAEQEELDWSCYHLYGLTHDELTLRDAAGAGREPPPVRLGERAFEIALARRMAAGEEETTWFARHGSTPITEVPTHWPEEYRALVERRIARIEADRNIALIERPEFKRRWNVEAWDTLEREALAVWLLDRLESPAYWPSVALQTTRDLAARAALDPDFAQVAALWAGNEGVALEPVIRELTLGEAVAFLPAVRYTDSGREKRRVWEQVWELQRQEDAVDARVAAEFSKRDGESADSFAKRLAAEQKARRAVEVGAIPRPPKYQLKDFQRPEFWRMRAALDVPNERFISYPFCGRDGDDAPLLGWAGWSHLQQAQALAAWYADRTGQDGWRGERAAPMLAGIAELLPWLMQWHNEIDPEFGDRPGDAYALWLDEELHANALTRAALDAWEPPKAPRRGERRAAGARTAPAAAE